MTAAGLALDVCQGSGLIGDSQLSFHLHKRNRIPIDNDLEIRGAVGHDIRQVQLAKAAIRAGIDTLLHEAGIAYEQLDAVYLAGGFGSYLHPDTCAAIGMIPRELIDKIKVLGNAAGQGASLMLLSKAELRSAEEIARHAQTIELSASAVFMEKYVDSMMF